ncbi:2OG-Fe(II) oxygenase [Ketobacter sp.]
MDAVQLSSVSMADELVDALFVHGWWVCDGFLSEPLVSGLFQDVTLAEHVKLKPAKIGRGRIQQSNASIRRDKTQWLNPDIPVQAQFLQQMDYLRVHCNRHLFLGLQEFEAHYAKYEVGGFYKTHVDALKGARNRVVSCVLYLNQGWQPDQCGELVLYSERGEEITRIEPKSNTAVFFLSEQFPHEVLPTRRPRYSIAGWYRVRP